MNRFDDLASIDALEINRRDPEVRVPELPLDDRQRRRVQLPIGPLFCILAGPTRGRGWSPTAARGELRRLAVRAGVRRRFAPHQLRHAQAVEMAHEGS
jgi:integrase